MNREDRNKLGTRAVRVAIIGNVFLTIFNITVGILSGSYALISEGAHTTSDIVTSVIAYVGFKIANWPANEKYPLGYGRAEAIAGLAIVVFLAIIAYEIVSGAIERLFFGGVLQIPEPIAIVMAFVGVVVNFFMSQYIISLGHRANSPSIVADGKHQRVDVMASIAILIGIMVAQYGFHKLDSIIGFCIGLLIVKTAYEVARENLDAILGKVPSQDMVDKIIEVSNSVDEVYGTHNVKINYLGSYATATMHIELDPEMNLEESHKVVHEVQNKILDDIDFVHAVNVHACPIGAEYDHSQEIDA